jgi:hypothetical protein
MPNNKNDSGGASLFSATGSTSSPFSTTTSPPVGSTLGTISTHLTHKGDKRLAENRNDDSKTAMLTKFYREMFPKRESKNRVGPNRVDLDIIPTI